MSVYSDPATGLPAIDFDGCPRLLAKLPPTRGRGGLRSFVEAVGTAPESEWRPLDWRPLFTPNWILDQKSHGSCVGFSSAGALSKARALAGETFQRLSGSFVYAHINGGQDQGAIITDALGVLRDRGTCLDLEMPWDRIYKSQIPPSAYETAKRFRAFELYTADTWLEIGSAVQLGFVPIFAVMVGGSFMDLDSEGVAGFDNGPGNHAVHADGMVRLPRAGWALDMPNSWGTSFGQSGRCYLTRRHVEGVQQDCYVIRAIAFDPLDPHKPPVAN